MTTVNRITRAPKPVTERSSGDLEHRQYTVKEFHKLADQGKLHSGDPFELLDGWIVPKISQNPPHVIVTNRLSKTLREKLANAWDVRSGNPITLSKSEPEPDIVIAIGPDIHYLERHPRARDVSLVIEVSDTTLDRNQTTKQAIYAAAKLPVYWIVNLVERQVEVYTQPRGGKNPGYRVRTDYGFKDSVPLVLYGKPIGSIPVREILPR